MATIKYRTWKNIRTALLLTGMLCCAQVFSADGEKKTTVQFVPLKFRNAENSDQFRSGRLAERFRQIAVGAVPRRKNSWTVNLELCGVKEVQHFSVTPVPGGKRELQVKVPLAFESWREDVLAHNWLMSVLLLAQLGENFEKDGKSKAYLIQSHWLVRGLARKAAGDTLFTLRPFARTHVAAYVYSANGHRMPLKNVVMGLRENGRDLSSIAEVESEFAGLLVDACEDGGFFRESLAEPVLRHALTSTDADPWQKLLQIGTEKGLFAGRDPDEWFQAYLERRLLSLLSPLTVEYFETAYRELTTLNFKGADGSDCTCGLTGLVKNRAQFTEINSLIDDLQLKLNVLSFRAPAGFQQPLLAIRQALTALRTEQSEERAAQLERAEQQLYEAIRARIELEHFLGIMERRHVSPADRFQRTLRAAEETRLEKNQLLPSVQKKLDEWDEYR